MEIVDSIIRAEISHALFNDGILGSRLRLPTNNCVPCATPYCAKVSAVSRLTHSSIRSLSQCFFPGNYGWSSSFCRFTICLKEVKEWQARKLRSSPQFYYSEIRLQSTQSYARDIIFSTSGTGNQEDTILTEKREKICRDTHLEIFLKRNWKTNSCKQRKWIRSNSNTNSETMKFGMALGSQHVFPSLFWPAWCKPALRGLLHHLLLLGCLFFLQSAIFYANEASALVEEIHYQSLYLEFRNMTPFESGSKQIKFERTHESLLMATLTSGNGFANMVLHRQALENKLVDLTPNFMQIFTVSENSTICKETYGIFPCSDSLMGNLFLMFVYGYFLLEAAKFISEGSEQLLQVMDPGLIGGLVLPILGALPDGVLILASGAFDSIDEAQQEVQVGIGVLAGSTILILTVAWAGSLAAGRCDLSGPDNTAKDMTLMQGFDLFQTGVTTDEQTRWGALVMMLSAAPYLCAQVPALDGNPGQGPASALAGFIIAEVGLFGYCVYQVASPWLQRKKIEEARLHLLRSSALQGIASFSSKFMSSPALLLQEETMEQATGLLREIFMYFDRNKDGKIAQDELRGLLLGLNIEESYVPSKKHEETWLNEFDTDADGMLTETEFLLGIQKWAHRVARQKHTSNLERLKKSITRTSPDFWVTKLEEAKKTLQLLEDEIEYDDDNLGQNPVVDTSKVYQKAILFLVSGAALATCFADPLIDSIQGFSTASRIPPFFVAFIVVPFASNASELLSSILFATKRRKRNISLTYSQIYGSVTMNNTLCLGIFLGLVYARGLTWDFSSEVTIILLNILCVGLIGISRTTFPLWYAIPVFSLYFASIGGVALLDYLLGWH